MGHKEHEAKKWVAHREYGWEGTPWEGDDEGRLMGKDGEKTRMLGVAVEFEHLVSPALPKPGLSTEKLLTVVMRVVV